MKEERKEKNSHTGSVSWSTGLLRYQKPAAPTAYNPGCHTALCGQGGRGGLPEGLACASLRSVPRTLHPGPGRGRATQCKTRSLHVCVSMRG